MVIIGLLLGGVLKGQEIIMNAKIKNLENDFNGITAAIYSYQDRYRALPGDDPRANSRFVSQDSGNVPEGDGSGKVGGLFDSITDTEESRFFWAHLRYAGLVAGEPIAPYNQPLNAFNGKTGVSSESSGTKTPPAMSGVYIGFSNIPVEVAIVVESRSDDNNPKKGGIQTDNGQKDYIGITATEINLYFAL